MSKRDAARLEQPMPIIHANQDSVQDMVIADIKAKSSGATAMALVIDIEARKQIGLIKYGTLLQAFNGRDALVDAYQETLDLMQYLRQGIAEVPCDGLNSMFDQILDIALELRGMLDEREHGK